jgi:hypothetical protein
MEEDTAVFADFADTADFADFADLAVFADLADPAVFADFGVLAILHSKSYFGSCVSVYLAKAVHAGILTRRGSCGAVVTSQASH